MLQSERESLAGRCADAVVARLGMPAGGFFSENVLQKFILCFQVIDRLAGAHDKPLLFGGVVPGYDLVVMRPRMWVPSQRPVFDDRVLSSVDERMLTLLAQALDQSVGGDGVHTFQSQDGLVYFGFKSAQRQEMLLEMGVSADAIEDATSYLSAGGLPQ